MARGPSIGVTAALAAWSAAAAARAAAPQTYADRAAVEWATRESVMAWLANHQSRGMAALAPDAVLLPRGLPPGSGTAAVRHFGFR